MMVTGRGSERGKKDVKGADRKGRHGGGDDARGSEKITQLSAKKRREHMARLMLACRLR